MAGAKNNIFKEKITDYIKLQLKNIQDKYGVESKQYKALELQYIKNSLEDIPFENDRMRHYESDMVVLFNGKQLRGVERLYERTILLEPSSVCAAHCRWCLRGQYPLFSLKDEEIINFAKYCGSNEIKESLKEVLITGGDPFMVPKKLDLVINSLKEFAPNIKIIRIGTRVPLQDPARVNDDLLEILQKVAPLKLEIATHINHPVELTKESRKVFNNLYNLAFKIYDQTVLLKGVNNDFQTLSELYDEMRYIGIEAHYLFHCVPMRGMSHHRTSVEKGLELISMLTSSGVFSGRSKPMYTLMTDIGKITLYERTILGKNENNELLIQSKYKADDFLRRNPSWKKPVSVTEDENRYLRVWYPDGKDI